LDAEWLKNRHFVFIVGSFTYVYSIIPPIVYEINHFFTLGQRLAKHEMRGLTPPALNFEIRDAMAAKEKLIAGAA
jgi:hypothetical protein